MMVDANTERQPGATPAGETMAAPTPARVRAALARHRRGQPAAARAICLKILKREPRNHEALHLLGVIAAQTGNYRPAVELIAMAIVLHPHDPSCHNDLGNALSGLGQLTAALVSYDRAIALQPDDAAAYNNRGAALKRLGQPDRALADYERALARQPDYAAASYNRGIVLKELGQPAAALASFDQVIALQADFAEAFYERGTVLWHLGQPAAALASLERAIALKPDEAAAYQDRGIVLHALGQSAAALASLERAIALKPDDASAYNHRGVVLTDLRQLEAALASLDRAIALKPDDAAAYNNRGIVLNALRQSDAALASLERAIALSPDYAQAYWNKSLFLLLHGDFERGWPLYEWRWQNADLRLRRRDFAQPQWCGAASLGGRTILLHSEQGLGDTLQFCRYARLVADLGARVVLEVPGALAGLLRGLAGVERVVVKGEPLPAFDLHCPLLSLPLAFKTTLDTIPAPPAYLRADGVKVRRWRDRLGAPTAPRVGLVWSGSTGHRHDRQRSLALAQLRPYLPATCDYVSLQQAVRERDRATLEEPPRIAHYGDALTDFAETAALCELMDIVISIDTSVAHLAGALGKETWLMLPFTPDWRWLLGRTDSVWYPRVRLYRQGLDGDWTTVFEQIREDLSVRVRGPCLDPG
jgi:tetratricopeptide (TPR) repeat protein